MIERKLDEKDDRDNKRISVIVEELMAVSRRVSSLEQVDRKISFPHWIVALCMLAMTGMGCAGFVHWMWR